MEIMEGPNLANILTLSDPSSKEESTKVTGKKGRKRKHDQTRQERRDNKYLNQAYINTRDKAIKPREFKDFDCKCKLKCPENIPADERSIEFNRFHTLGSYSAQNLYLLERVEEMYKKRTYTKKSPGFKGERIFSRVYYINNRQVCKEMFVKTFQISTARIDTLLKKIREGVGLIDRRGRDCGGHNKTSDEHVQQIMCQIKNVLENMASYYQSEQTASQQKPITVKNMYEMYKRDFSSRQVVSLSTYKAIYYKHFKNKTPKMESRFSNSFDSDSFRNNSINSSPVKQSSLSPIKQTSLPPNPVQITPPIKQTPPCLDFEKEITNCYSTFTNLNSTPQHLSNDVDPRSAAPFYSCNNSHDCSPLTHVSSFQSNFIRTAILEEPKHYSVAYMCQSVIPPQSEAIQYNHLEDEPHSYDDGDDNEAPKRIRKRKLKPRVRKQTREERKNNKYLNTAYINSRNEVVAPKVFKDHTCPCPLKCSEKISLDVRKSLFETFHNLGSYTGQNLFILERVEEINKKRCYVQKRTSKHERTYTRIYSLNGVKVCKEMFVKTLQVSANRVSTVMTKAREGQGLTDLRGIANGGHNKISDEARLDVINHINGIIYTINPNYCINTKEVFHFPQEYTFKRLYDLYKGEREKVVSFSTYKAIFYKDFAKSTVRS